MTILFLITYFGALVILPIALLLLLMDDIVGVMESVADKFKSK